MTNAELLAKIKAEIEWRIKIYKESYCGIPLRYQDLEELLSILSTLELEKPMKQDELEKEIENAWEKLEKDYSPSALDKTTILVSGLVGEKQFSKIARHFYELGCRRTAEKYDEIECKRQISEELVCNDLEKEIDGVWKTCNPIDEGMGVETANIHIEQFDYIARHFAEWGAEHLKK